MLPADPELDAVMALRGRMLDRLADAHMAKDKMAQGRCEYICSALSNIILGLKEFPKGGPR